MNYKVSGEKVLSFKIDFNSYLIPVYDMVRNRTDRFKTNKLTRENMVCVSPIYLFIYNKLFSVECFVP